MKKFVLKVIAFGIFCLLIYSIPSYTIDPFNVFHWSNIRNTGVGPNNNYIKTKYIINNPDKFDGYILGSSRVGSIHVERIKDSQVYNMNYSAGTPHENLNTLQTFIENAVDIQTVYLGIDSYSYTEDPEKHNEEGMRASYQYLTKNIVNMLALYMDPLLSIQSLSTILGDNDTEGAEYLYDYGWWCEYDLETNIDWENAYAAYGKSFLLNETLDDIAMIKELCDKNGIELVVFTNPMYALTYEESVDKLDYLYFLECLASITDYYNFSGLNTITVDTDNYVDPSHYSAYVGDLLIDTMIYHKNNDDLERQGFGVYVTKNNVKELLEILQN